MNLSTSSQTQEGKDNTLPHGVNNKSARQVLMEKPFIAMLRLERRRAERSTRPFVLMLLDAGQAVLAEQDQATLENLLASVSASTRETDLLGWYEGNMILGVLLTELERNDLKPALDAVHSRVSSSLRGNMSLCQVNRIHISFHVFPEESKPTSGNWQADVKLYPDLPSSNAHVFSARIVKRCIDIIGSLAAIVLLLPIFGLIAAAIKLSSKGPVLFRQERVGQYGAPFTFYKFRSMHFRADTAIHESYTRQFISGTIPRNGGAVEYKLRDDPRITRLGKVLRRTSLDELPQFYNVLKGDMSLVGPRPPLAYELAVYNPWHRRRLLEAKPGLTGLWQVQGRSKTGFDEMVRLDLQYAGAQSLWVDMVIILRTVWIVLAGEGAC